MPLRNAQRRGTAATSSWISEELLNRAFRRFTLACTSRRQLSGLQCQRTRGPEPRPHQLHLPLTSRPASRTQQPCCSSPSPHTQRRHAHNSPDPLEARRRQARRRMNHAAGGIQAGGGGLPFDPQVFLNDFWGRPKQPYWEWQAPNLIMAAFEEKMRRATEASKWTRLPAWFLKGWRAPPLVVEEVLPGPEPPPLLGGDAVVDESLLEEDSALVQADEALSDLEEKTLATTTSLETFEASIPAVGTLAELQVAYSTLEEEVKTDARFAVAATERLLNVWTGSTEIDGPGLRAEDDCSLSGLITFAFGTGHWNSVASRIVALADSLASHAMDLLARLVNPILRETQLFEANHYLGSWELVTTLTRRVLLSELDSQEKLPTAHAVKRFSRLLDKLPSATAEDWFMQTAKHLLHESDDLDRELRAKLINLWMLTGHRSSTVRQAQHQLDHQLRTDLFAQLFSRHNPSEVPYALKSLGDRSKCRVFAENFLPRLDLLGYNTRHCLSQAEVLACVHEKMHDCYNRFHQQRKREAQRSSEKTFLTWIPLQSDSLGTTCFGKPHRSTRDETRHVTNPGPTLKDNMPDTIPYLSLLAALQSASVDRSAVTIVFTELLRVLTSLNRPNLVIDIALAAKRHLRLGFDSKIQALIFEAAWKHCSKFPHAALGIFNRTRLFSAEHAAVLLESFIASSKSQLHPKQILPLFQYHEREGDPSTSSLDTGKPGTQSEQEQELDSVAVRSQKVDILLTLPSASSVTPPPFQPSYLRTAEVALHDLKTEPRPLPQHRVNLIHDSALHFARASRFSENTAFNCIMHLYRILTHHGAPLDARMSRAFVIAGVLRPIHKGDFWKRSPRRFGFIIEIVRNLEGEDVAKKIDEMARRAEMDEGRIRANRAKESARLARNSFVVEDDKGSVHWANERPSRAVDEDERVRRDENGRPVHSIKSWAKRMRRREWLAKGRRGTEGGWKETRRLQRQRRQAEGQNTYDYI